jgi:quinol-cytochrome oxidoreductase complex cytochrome b subunit
MNETMLVALSREEENEENNYADDFFWLHERGVDVIMVTAFMHLFKKLFLNVHDVEQEYAWKSGVFTFLMIQLTVFTGLVLCCTHLSEITLVIAANALHTFCLFFGKIFWWPFTDKLLNTDTLVRLAYLHYLLAFFVFYLGINHGIDMHYDWKSKSSFVGIKQQLNWWDEALSNEFSKLVDFIILLILIAWLMYAEPEALNYEIFMWGDVGFITDVRFYGVAPHWYFRPYMAWLVACPYHFLGIGGLVFFFCVLYFQVSIHGVSEENSFKTNKSILLFVFECCSIFLIGISYILNLFSIKIDFINNKYFKFIYRIILKFDNIKNFTTWHAINAKFSLQWLITYSLFVIAMLHTLTFLPYGRFYNLIGGNMGLLISYLYIFSFLSFSSVRNSWMFNNNKVNLLN